MSHASVELTDSLRAIESLGPSFASSFVITPELWVVGAVLACGHTNELLVYATRQSIEK